MAIKKIGTAELHHTWGRYIYKIKNGKDMYSSDELDEDHIMEFKAIGERPKKPTGHYGNDNEWKKYDLNFEQYNTEVKKIIPIVYSKIQEKSKEIPIRLGLIKDILFGGGELKSDLVYSVYKGTLYKFDRIGYTDEEMILQIMDLEDDERRKFERLKHKYSIAEQEEKEGKRPTIPEEVRIAVWRRDEGKCVKCSGREKLEYDHIIPISKGGSNTVRNIELLCEKCNREKRDRIG